MRRKDKEAEGKGNRAASCTVPYPGAHIGLSSQYPILQGPTACLLGQACRSMWPRSRAVHSGIQPWAKFGCVQHDTSQVAPDAGFPASTGGFCGLVAPGERQQKH